MKKEKNLENSLKAFNYWNIVIVLSVGRGQSI